MKLKYIFLTITLITSLSCQSQEQDEIRINYKAQTRGYLLKIDLVDKVLSIEENSTTSKIELSSGNYNKLIETISSIDFDNLKVENLTEHHAVDRAIPATFSLKNNDFNWNADLTHETNKEIKSIIDLILSFREK